MKSIAKFNNDQIKKSNQKLILLKKILFLFLQIGFIKVKDKKSIFFFYDKLQTCLESFLAFSDFIS